MWKQSKDCEFYQQFYVNGKELCGSGRNYPFTIIDKIRKFQLLHVYNCSKEWRMYSHTIEEKTNEISVTQKLLSILNLKHTIMSFDTMNIQKRYFPCDP